MQPVGQQHTYLQGDAIAQAVQQDNLPWDRAFSHCFRFRRY